MTEFIGIPYLEGGRDYTGVDCWGLVLLFYRDFFGEDLVDPANGKAVSQDEAARLMDVEKATIQAAPVPVPEIGDIALMAFRGRPIHVGVYVGNGRLLHVMKGIDSVIESWESPRLRGRVRGYYRVG